VQGLHISHGASFRSDRLTDAPPYRVIQPKMQLPANGDMPLVRRVIAAMSRNFDKRAKTKAARLLPDGPLRIRR
jgi:hypothetical protein